MAFILITGRTTKQGRAIHRGKESKDFLDEVATLQMNAADMAGLGVGDGDQVRLFTEHGETLLRCKKTDIPAGLVFVAYGGFVNKLVGSDTQGTGMPDFKGIRVQVERYAGH